MACGWPESIRGHLPPRPLDRSFRRLYDNERDSEVRCCFTETRLMPLYELYFLLAGRVVACRNEMNTLLPDPSSVKCRVIVAGPRTLWSRGSHPSVPHRHTMCGLRYWKIVSCDPGRSRTECVGRSTRRWTTLDRPSLTRSQTRHWAWSFRIFDRNLISLQTAAVPD